jgi:mono/diheme cytochrome c family protein
MPAARGLVIGVGLAFWLGCGGGETDKSASAPGERSATDASSSAEEADEETGEVEEEQGEEPAEAQAEAQKIFATRCFTCHGANGEGNGPGSAALVPKPRNFTDASWQTSVTDDHIAKIIQYGGAAVGKSPTMPGNPDLMSKPEVVQALVAYIRGLSAPQ